jgi:hypothetical protein
LALAGISAAPAAAATPDRGTYDITDSFTDTEVCAAAPWGFDVFVPTEHEYGFFDVFFDREGNFVKVIVHSNYDATITANGKTIVERDTWEITYYPDGTSRFTGSIVHIQGPGGIVVRDAGQVVFNTDGTVSYSHGPHQQLEGVSFCPALAP